jgi:hypothetical protein
MCAGKKCESLVTAHVEISHHQGSSFYGCLLGRNNSFCTGGKPENIVHKRPPTIPNIIRNWNNNIQIYSPPRSGLHRTTGSTPSHLQITLSRLGLRHVSVSSADHVKSRVSTSWELATKGSLANGFSPLLEADNCAVSS